MTVDPTDEIEREARVSLKDLANEVWRGLWHGEATIEEASDLILLSQVTFTIAWSFSALIGIGIGIVVDASNSVLSTMLIFLPGSLFMGAGCWMLFPMAVVRYMKLRQRKGEMTVNSVRGLTLLFRIFPFAAILIGPPLLFLVASVA